MKLKHIYTIIILNTLALCLASILTEYNEMGEKTKELNATMQTAIESAIDVSMMSEDFFSDTVNSTLNSQAINDTNGNAQYSSIKLINTTTGAWQDFNLYDAVMYYQDHRYSKMNGNYFYGLPMTNTSRSVSTVYNRLYGNVTTRVPNGNLKAFYDDIGKDYKSKLYLKKDTYINPENGMESFDTVEEEVPVIDQMGLNFYDIYTSNGSAYSSENIDTVEKEGKNGKKYYLTPYSLGVTYIDKDVLKVAIISHLQQLMLYKYDNPMQGVGCLDSRHTTGKTTIDGHLLDETIINNGVFEIDLNSIDIDIQYKIFDFYDNANADIVNKIEGGIAGGSIYDRPKSLKDSDTNKEKNGDRIVAKIIVKMDTHIPYTSSILSYFRFRAITGEENHLDVRNINDLSKTEGTEYTYVTYASVSR